MRILDEEDFRDTKFVLCDMHGMGAIPELTEDNFCCLVDKVNEVIREYNKLDFELRDSKRRLEFIENKKWWKFWR